MEWDKIEKFLYYGGSLKSPIFRGEVHEKSIYSGNCIKRGGGHG